MPMSETRQQIIELLGPLSDAHPGMRFGQLIVAIANLACGPSVSAPYDVEDADFLSAAMDNLAFLQRSATSETKSDEQGSGQGR